MEYIFQYMDFHNNQLHNDRNYVLHNLNDIYIEIDQELIVGNM